MAERKQLKTETLLRRKSQTEAELTRRDGVEIDIFRQLHLKCEGLETALVGYDYAGYNPSHDQHQYAPVKVVSCPVHNVKSAKFTDMDAFHRGEVYVRNAG